GWLVWGVGPGGGGRVPPPPWLVKPRRPRLSPPAKTATAGGREHLTPAYPASEVEQRYRVVLRYNRDRDAAAGRTLDGPHLSDMKVVHAAKGIPAADASTGEQKALLIGLELAHARLLREMTGAAPILLLAEVLAHLDPARRLALHGELAELNAQAWMTGADPTLFREIESSAGVVEVKSGTLTTSARRG